MEVSWVSAWRETYILLLYYSSDGSNPTTELEEKVRFKTFCADYTCKIERYRDWKRNCKWPSRANWTKFRINFLSIRSQFCTKLRIHSKKNLFFGTKLHILHDFAHAIQGHSFCTKLSNVHDNEKLGCLYNNVNEYENKEKMWISFSKKQFFHSSWSILFINNNYIIIHILDPVNILVTFIDKISHNYVLRKR